MTTEANAAPPNASSADSSETSSPPERGFWRGLIRTLASPQITTLLLMMSICLVLVGTLAQVHEDIWAVVEEYFRAWVCWIDLRIFFPPSFFPWASHFDWNSLPISSIPFPGGASIGFALAINLLAAHSTRFTVRVRGRRLIAGLGVLAVGILITWWVIASGHNREGVQGQPWMEYGTLWSLIKIGLVILWLGCILGALYVWRFLKRTKTAELGILIASAVGLGLLLAWIFAKGDAATLTDSSLRILYQLVQGQIAALVLLVACVLLFRQRAGIALLHGGVGLLMFGELFVSYYAAEQQMTLQEGETANYTRDYRSVELAIHAGSNENEQTETIAVPLLDTGSPTRYARGDVVSLNDLLLSFAYSNSSRMPTFAM